MMTWMLTTKVAKVRPLFDLLNKNLMKKSSHFIDIWVAMNRCWCISISTHQKCSSAQNPWNLDTTLNGLYAPATDIRILWLCPSKTSGINGLSEIIEIPHMHTPTFDNFFTSAQLLRSLKARVIAATSMLAKIVCNLARIYSTYACENCNVLGFRALALYIYKWLK